MKKKEYEQKLIQRLANRNEKYYRMMMKVTDKSVFFSLTTREHEINEILTGDMGITVSNRGNGIERYSKGNRLRHIRNLKKRR